MNGIVSHFCNSSYVWSDGKHSWLLMSAFLPICCSLLFWLKGIKEMQPPQTCSWKGRKDFHGSFR